MDIKHIKCAVVGDGDVGKTCLLYAYTMNNFIGDYVPTDMENFSITVQKEAKIVKLGLVDTAGQISYEKLRKHLYKDVDVFLVCYSVVNPTSYCNVIDKWQEELNSYDRKIPLVIVGTKTDLREDEKTLEILQKHKQRAKSREDGFDLKRDIKAKKYLECSSLKKEGIKEVFDENSIDTQQQQQNTHKQHTYYVIFPDNQVRELYLRRPSKIHGRSILEEICITNEIKEIDSFGLQYIGKKGEYLWLNLKNKIHEEIGRKPSRKRSQDFYRFYFRVKFYLHPQMVFTAGAKEIYFGEVKTKYLKGGFNLSLKDQISICALMAQAELGPVHLYTGEIEYRQFVPSNLKEGTESLFQACIKHKHKSIKYLNRQGCIQKLLSVLSDNKEYGMQWYNRLHILTVGEREESKQLIPVEMGIGPEYVYLYSIDGQELYSFHIGLVENLQRTNRGYCVVHLRADEGTESETGMTLHVGGVTPYISIEIFRGLAERATFYLSDQVIDQIKNELPVKQCQSWTKSKAKFTVYTYDLLRNMKESYSLLLAELSKPRVRLLSGLPTHENGTSGTLLGSQCKLCYDNFVSVVFKDCGHAVSCTECLFKLSNCPVCRSEVKLSHLTPLITPIN
ncbi:Cdc42-like protein [Oopsacas minuta]|uniref:Cdc42-like protein n=1 Tax=Oopsacas minuta TaxID=111878 RepID=A0AAV7KBQ5_9METZ|nr:Cdc42-like protein [Oopsacas minuta]